MSRNLTTDQKLLSQDSKLRVLTRRVDRLEQNMADAMQKLGYLQATSDTIKHTLGDLLAEVQDMEEQAHEALQECEEE